MLSATSSMSIILGVFIQFLLGTFLNWRTVALINIVFPVTAMICLLFIPESPHWLISKRRFDEAKKSLQWLRGWCEEADIMREYNQIYSSIHKQHPDVALEGKVVLEKQKFNIKDYAKRTFIEPYLLIILCFFMGHFSGMTTLQTYAVEIFGKLKAPIDKYYATLILGIVELLGTLVCVFLVHKTGKRLLTFISTLGCSACFLIVGVYAYIIGVEDHTHITRISEEGYSWIPTTFLISSAFLSHTCIRLLPWILIGEVFPNEVRANASGLSGGVGYIFGFTANKVFFKMVSVLTWPGTFWLYGCVALVGTIILYFILPETEGKPLAEIEMHFAGEQRLRKSIRKGSIHDVEGLKKGVDGIPQKDILQSEVIDSRL